MKIQFNKIQFQHDMALRQNVCLRQKLNNQEKEAGEKNNKEDDIINKPATVWKVLGYIPVVAPIAAAAFCLLHRSNYRNKMIEVPESRDSDSKIMFKKLENGIKLNRKILTSAACEWKGCI